MRNLCVDASVVLRWVFPGANRPVARRILDAAVAGDVGLRVPDFLFLECAQAARNYAFHPAYTPRITVTRALGVVSLICRLELFQVLPTHVLVEEACRIACVLSEQAPEEARRREVTVYDSIYLALAVREGCELWTNDRQFATHARQGYECVRLLGEDALNL